MALAAVTLLHLLVFVYWLGGDLGAFYASYILADARQPPSARAATGQVLNAVDLAPNVCLVLAAPTGLTLAASSGWLALPTWGLALLWAASLAWLAVSWRTLTRPGESPALARLDLVVRWGALAALTGAGAASLLRLWPVPLFIGAKMLLLASAMGLGLVIRSQLKPFGPVFVALAAGRSSPEGDTLIKGVLDRARLPVVGSWTAITTAAFLGLWKPS